MRKSFKRARNLDAYNQLKKQTQMKTTYSRAIIACASIATAATAIELTTQALYEYNRHCNDAWRYNWD